jgi:DNA-binding transcriptional regulator YiaG
MYKYTECGLEGVKLKNGFEEYETEHGKGVGIHDLEGLHAAIGRHLVCNKAVLSGAEVRFLRKELELSQVELANFFGVGESSVRAYESDRTQISGPADRILRVLYLEMVDGEGEVRQLLERLATLNREMYHLEIKLEDTPDGWKQAA